MLGLLSYTTILDGKHLNHFWLLNKCSVIVKQRVDCIAGDSVRIDKSLESNQTPERELSSEVFCWRLMKDEASTPCNNVVAHQ